MGTRAQPLNPYRKGKEAGRAYAVAFKAWRDQAKATSDYTQPRPPTPACPYALARTVRTWQAGVRDGMAAEGVR